MCGHSVRHFKILMENFVQLLFITIQLVICELFVMIRLDVYCFTAKTCVYIYIAQYNMCVNSSVQNVRE